jgi:hypothetical protein
LTVYRNALIEEKIEPINFSIDGTMKNIYNLVSDAFDAMRGHTETNYNITVKEGRGYCDVTIRSRKVNSTRTATLSLTLDPNDNLLDFHYTNNLFTNNNWDMFCDVIEAQVYNPNEIVNANNSYVHLEDLLNSTQMS